MCRRLLLAAPLLATILGTLAVRCSAQPAVPSYTAGQLNGRGDSQNFAPVAPVGIYWSCLYGPSMANRGNSFVVGPSITAAEREAGAVASWAEFWQRTFDPAHNWLCGNGTTRNGLFAFECPHGTVGAYRRFQTIDEREKAIEYGTPWLVDGFIEGCTRYVDAGSEIAVHEGCPDEGRWAADTLKAGTPESRAKVLQTICDHDAPLAAAGVTIGSDFLSTYHGDTISYARWKMNDLIGVKQQMEGSFGPDQVKLYKGATIFMHYGAFDRYHLNQSEDVKARRMPAVGSREFASWYGEFRIVLPYDVCKDKSPVGYTPEYINAVAGLSRELQAKSPNIRVLLNEWLVRGAMKVGVPVERFLPEGAK